MVAQAAAARLTHIQIIKTATLSRVILSLSASRQPHISHLNNPNRIVLDLADTVLTEQLKNLNLPTQTIMSISSAYPQANHLVLTLALTSSAKITIIPTVKSNRFILDVASAEKSVDLDSGVRLFKARSKPLIARTKLLSFDSSKLKRVPVRISNIKKSNILTIVIDPGHGGKDPGAIGDNGTKEKDVVLSIAKKLAQQINQHPNMHAVLTRDGDYFVPLRDRIRLARKDKADLFMSIHADSYFNSLASGASVYTLSHRGATSEAARWLARRENYSELGGVDLGELGDQSYLLRSVLIDLAQTATTTDSMRLGSLMLRSLDAMTKLRYSRVEQAPFVVLKSPDIPSVLVETGFISNVREEKRLQDQAYQAQLAQAMFNGVLTYVKKAGTIQQLGSM